MNLLVECYLKHFTHFVKGERQGVFDVVQRGEMRVFQQLVHALGRRLGGWLVPREGGLVGAWVPGIDIGAR